MKGLFAALLRVKTLNDNPYVPSVSLSNVPHAAVEPVPVEGGVRRVALS